MSLCSSGDIEAFLDSTGASAAEKLIIDSVHNSAEKAIKNYCNRELESTAYSKYYDGDGEQYLLLDDYPITALTRVATGRRSAIRIQNTSDNTSASVSVDSTGGVLLEKDGTVNSTGATFASNTTMSAMVSAINAIGSGWSAVIENNDYNNFKSTELVEMYGKSAINSNWVYLEMPDEAIDDFEVFPARGELYREMGWPEGNNNIFVKYTAGLTTIPDDLQLAVKIMTKYFYQKRNEESFGTKEYWAGDMRLMAEDGDFPKEVFALLSQYKRHLI